MPRVIQISAKVCGYFNESASAVSWNPSFVVVSQASEESTLSLFAGWLQPEWGECELEWKVKERQKKKGKKKKKVVLMCVFEHILFFCFFVFAIFRRKKPLKSIRECGFCGELDCS